MNQAQRRQYLIRSLLNENPAYRDWGMPQGADDQQQLLRGLINVRPAQKPDAEFLRIQDAYLREATAQKGVTDVNDLSPIQPGLYLWQGDITTLKCDAIVNAANSGMTGCYVPNHRCIDNAIHTFAGVQLRLACEEIMQRQGHPEPTGQAKITSAFNLLSRLPESGSGEQFGKRRVLLHLHRRIPFSQRAGGGNRRADGESLPPSTNQREKGDLQCFQGN